MFNKERLAKIKIIEIEKNPPYNRNEVSIDYFSAIEDYVFSLSDLVNMYCNHFGYKSFVLNYNRYSYIFIEY